MRSSMTMCCVTLAALAVACAHRQRPPETVANSGIRADSNVANAAAVGTLVTGGTGVPARVVVTPDSIRWEDAPGLAPGAKRALLMGDPAKPGPFVYRMQAPAGHRNPPHWHSVGENVTVLSGTLSVGVGDTFDVTSMQDIPAGGYYFAPPKTHHYVMAKTAVTAQVHGIGPIDRIFVNPGDAARGRE